MSFRSTTMLILTLTALGGSAAFAQDQPAAPQSAEAAPAPSSPLWLMSCSNEQQAESLLCEFSQSIVLSQGNQSQRVATASFNREAGGGQTNAAFVLPYAVSLPDPVRILVDEEEVGTLAWQSCDTGGCYATAEVDDAWLEQMRSGEQLTAALKASDGRDVTFTFQLEGFTRAEDMLP